MEQTANECLCGYVCVCVCMRMNVCGFTFVSVHKRLHVCVCVCVLSHFLLKLLVSVSVVTALMSVIKQFLNCSQTCIIQTPGCLYRELPSHSIVP